MTTVAAAGTAADLVELEGRWELVAGVLVEMPPNDYRHGKVSAGVMRGLSNHVETAALGDVLATGTGFRIARDPDTVLAPDVAFVRADRVPDDVGGQAFPDLAPDLVVEVTSPSDRAGAMAEKVARWLAAGVILVWVIYPAQKFVAVHAADGVTRVREVLTGGDVLPGLEIDLSSLFA